MKGIPNELTPHVEAIFTATKNNREVCFSVIALLMAPHVDAGAALTALHAPRDISREVEIAMENMRSEKDKLPKDDKKLQHLMECTRKIVHYSYSNGVKIKKLTPYHFRLYSDRVKKDTDGNPFYIDCFPTSKLYSLSSSRRMHSMNIDEVETIFNRIFQHVEKSVLNYED